VWPTLIFYERFNMGCKLMWPTIIFIMKVSMGSGKLLWPIVIGLISVVLVYLESKGVRCEK
jgi:hypothetical protein